MNTYHNRIKWKYKFMSYFYDFVEIFFSNKETNPRYGLANLIPNNNLKILDVCFGTGNSTMLVSKNNNNNKITGIDLSMDMLNVAKNKIIKQNLINVNIVRMDALNMSFKDESFDIATSSFGLHEMEYPVMEKILKEINRVLKKDGKFYLVDYEILDSIFKRSIFQLYLLLTSPPHVKEFLNYNWDKIMGKCGFRIDNIESYRISQIICTSRI